MKIKLELSYNVDGGWLDPTPTLSWKITKGKDIYGDQIELSKKRSKHYKAYIELKEDKCV